MAEPASWTEGALDDDLLSRIEDAGINASAPPQQRWFDGWILRFNPGKAKRARCINAVAEGRLPLDAKLQLASGAFRDAGVPMVVRITRFSRPPDLDSELARRGYALLDDTRVMVCRHLSRVPTPPLPPGMHWTRLDAAAFAEEIGALRDSPLDQRLAHAERIAMAPVPYRGHAIRRDSDGLVLACGQYAREAEFVGLYDVHTRVSERSRGLARMLCEHMLHLASVEGASIAYLQVDAANHAARRVYRALGFSDGYAYHYRQEPGVGPGALTVS